MQSYAVGLGLGLVVPEDHGDLDLAGAQQLERLGRVGVGEGDLEVRVLLRQCGHGAGKQRADGRREARQPHPPGTQPDVGRQLGAGRVDAPEDLGGSVGEQPPGRSQPDATTHPLQELRAGLRLEPGEVVAHRRL